MASFSVFRPEIEYFTGEVKYGFQLTEEQMRSRKGREFRRENRPRAAEIDKSASFPVYVFKKMAAKG